MPVALLPTEAARQHDDMPATLAISNVIEAIGGEGFAGQLLDFLAGLVGAYHCTIFKSCGHDLKEVASAGLPGTAVAKGDLALYDITRHFSQASSSKIRIDVSNLDATHRLGARDGSRQRIVVSVQRTDTRFILRILRSSLDDITGRRQLQNLRQSADLLVSLVVRHVALFTAKPNLAPILTSLEFIEDCLPTSANLSRREAQVCSRILYGLSSCGIALDLGIGKESVVTYRKRAYQRLGIGTTRELLIWYLALWSQPGISDQMDRPLTALG